MNNFFNHPIFKQMDRYKDLVVAGMFLCIVILIIVPLPAFLLDIFLTLNIAVSVLVLLMAIFTKKVLDFSIFPTLLLVTTLFRLGLNISSTRLILSTGDPGEVVTSFGEFVTSGDMVVGTVVFVIIVIVQFLVISNGSTRVAEVSARFALDEMPGKQMAIDNELSNGSITDVEARRRREEVQLEAKFLGSMDGASKFVKGDAIAGIIIVLINFIGGILIFMMKGYDAMDALQKFGTLTIGDGLVSQVPALLISVAAGVLVTRTPSKENLGVQFSDQLLSIPKAIAMGSVVMFVLALIPGLPFIPFMAMAILLGLTSYLLFEGEKQKGPQPIVSETETVAETTPMVDRNSIEYLSQFLEVPSVEVQIGLGLVPLVQDKRKRECLERISNLREILTNELGIILPGIPLVDNLALEYNEYRILVKGVAVATGNIYLNEWLVLNPYGDIEVDGREEKDPVYGEDCRWVSKANKVEAERLGYSVVDDLTVLMMHLNEVVRHEASSLLGRKELKQLLDILKEKDAGTVEDVVPTLLSLGELLLVLKDLLREQVSIKDLGTILDIVATYASINKSPKFLVEKIRLGMNRNIVIPYLNESKQLDVLTMGQETSKLLSSRRFTMEGENDTKIVISPDQLFALFRSIEAQLFQAKIQQKEPVLMVPSELRRDVKKLIESQFSDLAVFSVPELSNGIHFNIIGSVDINE